MTPRKTITHALVALLLLMPIGCNRDTGAKAPAKTSFDIGMVTFAGYAPLYLAKEKNLFGDLNVQLKRIEEVPSIRAAVAKKELEAYLATPDIALDTNTAAPGRAVWAIDESAGGDGVVVAGDIKDLAGLKGRQVAAEPGLPPNFVLLYLLYKNGMSLKDVQYKDMTTQNAATAFVSKSVDAAAIYEPYLSTAKGQRKGSRVVISSAQLPGMIVDLIFAREDVIESRPSDVARVIDGWRKAQAYIREHPDEAYPIMAKSFNLPVEEFKNVVAGIRWLDLPDNQRLYGSASNPGPLFQNFEVVGEVLRRNRPDVYKAQANTYLIRKFIEESK